MSDTSLDAPRAHARIVYLGPVSPHWEVYGDWGDRTVLDEFRTRVLARLVLLPRDDPQFRRNRERVTRDAEREHFVMQFWLRRDPTPGTEKNEAKKRLLLDCRATNQNGDEVITGIAPEKALIATHPDMVARAHALGLTVTAWTFRADEKTSYPSVQDEMAQFLYTFGIVSLGVYSIVLAGYAANSKFPFLGGIRSSAQMISYEIAMGMSVIPVFMLVGDLNLGKVIDYQASGAWLVFKQPVAFFIFLVAAFAETNRLPFDLPESETELVGGYHTEYSSMKFGMFFIGEYANMFAGAAMMTTLFFGGWTLPILGLDQPAESWWVGLIHIGIFMAKMLTFMGIFIWVRWMLPRFRYDQLMDLGWRRLIPLALANIILTAGVLAFTNR